MCLFCNLVYETTIWGWIITFSVKCKKQEQSPSIRNQYILHCAEVFWWRPDVFVSISSRKDEMCSWYLTLFWREIWPSPEDQDQTVCKRETEGLKWDSVSLCLLSLKHTFNSHVPDLFANISTGCVSLACEALWSVLWSKCTGLSLSAQRLHRDLVETVWWAGLHKYCMSNYYYVEWVKRSIRVCEVGQMKVKLHTRCTALLLEKKWIQTWETEWLWAEEKEKREHGRRTKKGERKVRWERHNPQELSHDHWAIIIYKEILQRVSLHEDINILFIQTLITVLSFFNVWFSSHCKTQIVTQDLK